MRRWLGAASLLVVTLAEAACFDSRWLQMQQAQASAAKQAAPSEIRATPETEVGPEAPGKAVRALKVRAYATPRHAAEVVDWPRRFAELVDDANRILGPTLGARLEIEGARAWSPRGGDEDLEALSRELAELDPGQGAEWVVGLAGSLPRLELSFHQLGLANVMGKHLMVRATNDAREYEAIQQNLDRVDEKERLALYRARRRHKTVAVFLHEIGHTLGAIHERDRRVIMSPHYDAKSEGFSDASAELLRLVLHHRLEPSAKTEQEFARALADLVKRTSDGWDPAERDALLARLEHTASIRGGPSSPGRRSPGGDDPLAALRPADRALFEQATAEARAGRPRDAWARIKPLVGPYRDVLAVQDLRCQIAMKLGLSLDEVEAQCQRAVELTMAAPGKRP
jgi:hypothetical protein